MKKTLITNEEQMPIRKKNFDNSLDSRLARGLGVLQGKATGKERMPREENSQSSMARRMRLEPLSYYDFSSTMANKGMLSTSIPEANQPFTPPISSHYNPISFQPAHSKSLSKKRKAITFALNDKILSKPAPLQGA